MKKGQVCQLDIISTEYGGYGIAEKEGLKVYVKNTFPGQKVEARISKKRTDYAEGKKLSVIEKADYEVEAGCPHFQFCGGCSSLNLSYEKQLELKEKEVFDLFKEGNIEIKNYLGIQGSPEVFEYRNKMEFTFGDFEKGGELSLGMHIKGSPFGIITVDQCLLVDEDYRKILKETLEYFKGKNLPYYRVLKHEGYLRNLVVRKTKNTGEIMINIVTTSQIDFDLEEFKNLMLSLNLSGTVKSLLHTTNDSLSDAVIPEKVEVLHGIDFITEEILGLKFKISPFSFFQTNSKGAEALYSIVKEFLGESKDKTIFDLYCGTGTIGQIVSKDAKKVIGIELIEEAVEAAKENSALNHIENCEFIAGDVAKVITEVKAKPDIIIVDPPRTGVHPTALRYLVDFNAKEIIYVSCNPKTLVNDLNYLLAHGYELDRVKFMDMFPNTPHVETVVRLIKK